MVPTCPLQWFHGPGVWVWFRKWWECPLYSGYPHFRWLLLFIAEKKAEDADKESYSVPYWSLFQLYSFKTGLIFFDNYLWPWYLVNGSEHVSDAWLSYTSQSFISKIAPQCIAFFYSTVLCMIMIVRSKALCLVNNKITANHCVTQKI